MSHVDITNQAGIETLSDIALDEVVPFLALPRKAAWHYLDGRLGTRAVSVALVGCGGTGSQVLTGLTRLHMALLALGHPFGLNVTAYDDDRVSNANVGRQLFYPSDIGQSKSATLITRANLCYNLRWHASSQRFTGERGIPDMIITCVDTASARRTIAKNLARWDHMEQAPYWLDCGNSRRKGQVFLTGGPRISIDSRFNKKITPTPLVNFQSETQDVDEDSPMTDTAIDLSFFSELPGVDLPRMEDVLPDIFDVSIPEDDTPSCSLAQSLRHQDLFINDLVSRAALCILWQLLSEGRIVNHGYWINLEDGRMSPVSLREPEQQASKPLQHGRKAATNG